MTNLNAIANLTALNPLATTHADGKISLLVVNRKLEQLKEITNVDETKKYRLDRSINQYRLISDDEVEAGKIHYYITEVDLKTLSRHEIIELEARMYQCISLKLFNYADDEESIADNFDGEIIPVEGCDYLRYCVDSKCLIIV